MRRLAIACFLAATVFTAAAHAAGPPPQPADGPGGVGDKGATIVKRALGTASAATFVFHKAGPAPSDGRPTAIVLHAWGATNPRAYGAWIDHLARNGWLVVWPRFQEFNKTRPADATANATALLKSAFAALKDDADAKPDLKRLAYLGHLAGAPLAANLAAASAAEGLPEPRLVFVVNPGGIARDAKSRGIELADLSTIPAGTMMIAMAGDRDTRAADAAGKRILRDAATVPQERKLIVRALSDDHGFPATTATLASPAGVDQAYDAGAITVPPDPKDRVAPPFKWTPDVTLTGEQQTLVGQINIARADALDYLAFWRVFDMAATAAFAGKDATSLKNDPSFSDMGRWADGWPVKRLGVETLKPLPPAAPTTTSTVPTPPAPTKPGRGKPAAAGR